MALKMADREKAKDVSVVEGLLEELPDNFLACRDLRHAWGVSTDFYVYDDPKQTKLLVVARDLVCMRCETHRREVFVQRKWGLEKVRNSYMYSDGYSLKGVPRGTKAAESVHNVMYRRAMTKVAKLAKVTA